VDTQRLVDYTNDCQKRVTAQTGILGTALTVTVPSGTGGLLLPTNLVQLYSVKSGVDEVPAIAARDYVRSVSLGSSVPATQCHAVIGRTLYLLPSPSVDTDVTLIYAKRSDDIDSGTQLEVSGEYERACERLVGAYILLDDGQPELAARSLADYDADIARLRLRAQRRGIGIGTQRIRLRGTLRP
jgi:hypothetical protein